jgi:hypothetical protein
MLIARGAARLDCRRTPYTIELADGGQVRTRSVIIASGARYRRPLCDNLTRFEGAGVYYSATHIEAQLCIGEEVIVVGGGNFAGQAAMFLSLLSRHVHMLVRGAGLVQTMSRYLVQRIEESPSITIRTRTQIEHVRDEGALERVRWHNTDSGEVEERPIRHVFIMTGADPNTAWLYRCVALDGQGFIKPEPICTRKISPLSGGHSRGRRTCSRPAYPACSPLGTCAREASSASPPRSAKDRSASSSFTNSWRPERRTEEADGLRARCSDPGGRTHRRRMRALLTDARIA